MLPISGFTWQMIIAAPPLRNRNLRPARSMTKEDRSDEAKFTRLRITDPRMAFWLLNPTVRNSTGEKTAMTITPVRSKNEGIATTITR
jgi:hypothetical protein